MEFPLTDLLNREKCTQWIVKHFHPAGLKCPNCKAGVEQARKFRITRRSQLTVYRCRVCNQTYNLYSGTLLAQHHLPPEQVVLLLRGIVKGESTKSLAGELQLNYKTVLTLRHQLQDRAEQLQSEKPLSDTQTETDEMFQNAGKKERSIVTCLTHLDDERTSDEAEAPMTMTAPPLLERLDEAVGKSDCEW